MTADNELERAEGRMHSAQLWGQPRAEAAKEENKCLYHKYWLYKHQQPFCVPGGTPCVLCPQPHPSFTASTY